MLTRSRGKATRLLEISPGLWPIGVLDLVSKLGGTESAKMGKAKKKIGIMFFPKISKK